MGERIEKVKEHVKKHKTMYCCVGTAVVCVTATTIVVHKLHNQPGIKVDTGNAISNSTVYGDVITKTESITRLSYELEDRNSDRGWKSQTACSMETGESEANISKHLNHNQPLKSGLELKRTGVRMAL